MSQCNHHCHYEDFHCFIPCCDRCGQKFEESDWTIEAVKDILDLYAWAMKNHPEYFKPVHVERKQRFETWLQKQPTI